MPKKKKILSIFFIIICIIMLTGCEKKSDETILIDKANQEIKFLDDKIITIANDLNTISFSNYKVIAEDIKEVDSNNEENSANLSESKDENNNSSKEKSSESEQNKEENDENNKVFKLTEDLILNDEQNEEIDWSEIIKSIENIYKIWPTIYIDLEKLNIDKLSNFTENLDNIALDAQKKDKNNMLNDLSKIYDLIFYYKSNYSKNEAENKIMEIKSKLILAYCNIDKEEWKNANIDLEECINIISTIGINEENNYNKFILNRINIMLLEMKNSIDKKDKKIFFLRYKNILQELNTIKINKWS